jgi:hypothetical protein
MSFSFGEKRDKRAMTRRRALLAGAIAAGALAILPSVASAVVTSGPNGRIGYLPLNGQGPTASGASRFAANGNLDYNGGPVMPSNKQFAIFWQPSGFSFPAGYASGITQFMKDVSADHNLPTDTYSVGAQYFDSTGKNAASSMSYGGTLTDTTSFPTSGCPPYTGIATSFSICLTDLQIANEVNSFVAAHGLQRGLTNQYFVFLPPFVGSCFDSAGTQCFDHEFCAYHSFTNSSGQTTIYANESFTPIDPAGCGTGNYPNGTASKVDDQLSTLSHETNEAREDPLLNGWFNKNTGAEGADQCRNTSDDYGNFLGGTPGVNAFNQVINGHHYILQRDWSNAANGCEQRYDLTGTTFGPFSAKVGQNVNFSIKFKDREGGHLKSASWTFGDGASANGASVNHTFHSAGTFRVKTVGCTNTKLCLFGDRKIKIKKAGRRHRKAHPVAVPLRVR